MIDFGDTHLGDAANDLAWSLDGAPPAFAAATAYDRTALLAAAPCSGTSSDRGTR
ncbi:hypothetical protein [Nocardia sp. MW-W600-9]